MAASSRAGWLLALLPVVTGAQPADAPAQASADTPQQAAAALHECVPRLGPDDTGEERIAERCPAVSALFGSDLLADLTDDDDWKTHLDRGLLEELDAAMGTFRPRDSQVALPRERLAAALARAEQAQKAPRSWWQRILDLLTAPDGARAEPPPAWLVRLLESLRSMGLPDGVVRRSLTGFLLLAGLVASILLVRSGVRSWRVRAGPGRGRAAATASVVPASVDLPGTLAERVVALFSRRVDALDASGLLPGARALSCPQIALRAGALAGGSAVVATAGVVERTSYAPITPPAAELLAAESILRAQE